MCINIPTISHTQRKMGTPCYIIGVTKQIRSQIGKSFGDTVEVVLKERDSAQPAMWKCPKCGREFKKKEQSHYCGEKPKTIDEYILSQDADKQEDLRCIRQILRRALRKRRNGSPGVCLLIGKGIISFTLPLQSITSDFIRDPLRSHSLLKNCRNTKRIRERSAFPTARLMRC